jgi:uncharacterized protein
MFLDFGEIPGGGLDLDRSIELADRGEGGDRLLVGPVRLVGRATSATSSIELVGRIEARVRLECCRCLDPIEAPVTADFSLVVVSEASEFGAGEQETAPEDMRLFYAASGGVDLREVAREQVYLNLPLKPVCRPDCAGLCPTCGVNRNRIECRCRSAETDPRLAPLLDLKKRMGGSDNDGEPQA